MKKLMLALAISGLMAAPVFAQEGEEPPREGGQSMEEMIEELHKLMKKASQEMGELETELAKASLDSPKADVIAERIKKMQEMMKEGKLDELPEGLRKHIEENPEEVAKATGKSNEEIKKIAQSNDELVELLRKNPELLKKLAENQSTIDGIIEKQQAAEKKIEETLKKQQESADAAKTKVDESVELAHNIKAKGQGKPGEGQPKNEPGKEGTKDPRDQPGKQGDTKKPTKGAEEGYQPGEGEMDPEDKIEEYERGKEGGFQADRERKGTEGAAGSEDRREPAKYKGFLRKWAEETKKKGDERKEEEK
jgi:hypothetical protein